MDRETQVLIVGGGAVGLLMAIDLAWRGIDVTVVEIRAVGETPGVKKRHPGFLGTVSLAPPTNLSAMWHGKKVANSTSAGYLVIIASGIEAADPSFDVRTMLGSAKLAQMPRMRGEACLEAAGSPLKGAPADGMLVKHWADLPAVKAFARANRPDVKRGYGPIYLQQGDADKTIPVKYTRQAGRNLCRFDDTVEYKNYPGMDHDPLVFASFRDQIAWIADRFAGAPAPTNCGAPGQ